ncbi:hypothetical protein EJ110_NYTH53893 [Nymphaea thermarum]|nr:hypothetical protein EJ110_NYTH53893 [Nymphaea thermarum]
MGTAGLIADCTFASIDLFSISCLHPERQELLKILTWYQSQVQHCPPLISQKLNHSNYLTWKRQIVLFIKSHRLYGHIDGTTPAPPSISSPSSLLNLLFTSGETRTSEDSYKGDSPTQPLHPSQECKMLTALYQHNQLAFAVLLLHSTVIPCR